MNSTLRSASPIRDWPTSGFARTIRLGPSLPVRRESNFSPTLRKHTISMPVYPKCSRNSAPAPCAPGCSTIPKPSASSPDSTRIGLCLGTAAAFLGKHAEAICLLTEAARLEAEPDILFRFAGPRTLLAMAQTRAGLWDAARAQHRASFELLRRTDHVYAETFQTLSACGLGDIELRAGNQRACR